MAEEGTRALASALPRAVADGTDLAARSEAQYGAWLCGADLGATTMSLHHKLCHTLGGTFDLPHAQTHTVVLPHALAFNAPAAPQAVAALRRALGGAPDPARELWELAGRLGEPRSLAELGMAEADIARIADLAVAQPYANPGRSPATAWRRCCGPPGPVPLLPTGSSPPLPDVDQDQADLLPLGSQCAEGATVARYWRQPPWAVMSGCVSARSRV